MMTFLKTDMLALAFHTSNNYLITIKRERIDKRQEKKERKENGKETGKKTTQKTGMLDKLKYIQNYIML